METKDWLMLLIPVICNGVVVFLLQKFFERNQIKQLIKHEYYSELRCKIDVGLELHAKATRIANEGDLNKDEIINKTIQEFFDSCLNVYYYYVQNQIIFSAVEKDCKKLADLIMDLSMGVNEHSFTSIQISNKINSIRDILQEIKKTSMC